MKKLFCFMLLFCFSFVSAQGFESESEESNDDYFEEYGIFEFEK